MCRIGHGFDIHRFDENGCLILGGIEFDYPRGMKGHSDGDVVIHSICNALMGARAKGDIGEYFPPGEDEFENISGSELLKRTLEIIEFDKYEMGNLDVSIIAEEPAINPYKKTMTENLGDLFGVESALINIKANSMEKLGEIGRNKGIAVHSVVLIKKGK